jgi:hypothetical protein
VADRINGLSEGREAVAAKALTTEIHSPSRASCRARQWHGANADYTPQGSRQRRKRPWKEPYGHAVGHAGVRRQRHKSETPFPDT